MHEQVGEFWVLDPEAVYGYKPNAVLSCEITT